MASTVAPAEQFDAPQDWQSAKLTATLEGSRLEAGTWGDEREFALRQVETEGLSVEALQKLLSDTYLRVFPPFNCYCWIKFRVM